MDGRPPGARIRDGILRRAFQGGRRVDPEGYSLERNHRRQRPDGWGNGGDETERSGGDDWTRRR